MCCMTDPVRRDAAFPDASADTRALPARPQSQRQLSASRLDGASPDAAHESCPLKAGSSSQNPLPHTSYETASPTPTAEPCEPTPHPRRATTRPAHLCRGKGGRGCRCHPRARRDAARPLTDRASVHAIRRDCLPPPIQILPDRPCRPQGPPQPLFDARIALDQRGHHDHENHHRVPR